MSNTSIIGQFTQSSPSDGKFMQATVEGIKAVRSGVIVKDTRKHTTSRTTSGIFIPVGEDDVADKKYNIGEVIAVGSEVRDVKVGDIVIYTKATAWRIPNAWQAPLYFKVEESVQSIVCVLPPISDEEQEAIEKAANEAYAAEAKA